MVFSSIFRVWREFWGRVSPKFFGELFMCMICLPFWLGIFLSMNGLEITNSYFDLLSPYIGWFFDGCIASGGVWFIHTIQEKLEK